MNTAYSGRHTQITNSSWYQSGTVPCAPSELHLPCRMLSAAASHLYGGFCSPLPWFSFPTWSLPFQATIFCCVRCSIVFPDTSGHRFHCWKICGEFYVETITVKVHLADLFSPKNSMLNELIMRSHAPKLHPGGRTRCVKPPFRPLFLAPMLPLCPLPKRAQIWPVCDLGTTPSVATVQIFRLQLCSASVLRMLVLVLFVCHAFFSHQLIILWSILFPPVIILVLTLFLQMSHISGDFSFGRWCFQWCLFSRRWIILLVSSPPTDDHFSDDSYPTDESY